MTDLAAERCDRCGASAKSRWQFKRGELYFCGHHTQEYVGGLTQVAILQARKPEDDAVAVS